MATHAPQTILFATNNGLVMTDGYTSRLGKGQLGIVDKDGVNTALGQKVTNVLSTTDKNRLFELRLGAATLDVNRSQTNKNWSSMPFKLSEITEISVAAPKVGTTVDKMIVGYDGIDATSAIVLTAGDNEVLDITLSGEAIGMLGYEDATVTIKQHLTAPSTGSFTMHQIITEAVQELKNVKLRGNVPITNYISINPVNSENPSSVTGANYTFYTLAIPDEGKFTDLGKVQAQYPTQTVKRQSYDSGISTYVILAATGTTLSNYAETTVTLADANCDGIPEATPASVSTAWVTGSTCVADAVTYTIQLADDDCGVNKLAALQAAYPDLTIVVNTDSPNSKKTATLTGASGAASLVINGTTYSTTFITDLTTTAAAFVTANGATILSATGTTVTSAGAVLTFTHTTENFPTISAVAGGLTETLSLLLPVGTSSAAACQTVYRTVVYSNVVCEECSSIMRDLFTVGTPPAPYQFIAWDKETVTWSATAKMGILLKGLVNIFSGDEEYRDEIPFIYSSTRISVANEAPGTVSESFRSGDAGRFAVKLLSRATEPGGLGKDLRDLEERTRVYFTNAQRHEGNNYAKAVLGEESLLKPLKQYITYSIKVSTDRFAQAWSGKVNENFNYLIAVEVGKQTAAEALVNALATAAGLPTVVSY